jgi:hypothetical protein
MRPRSGAAQNKACSCAERVPATRQRRSREDRIAGSSESAPEPRSRTAARPAAHALTRPTSRSPSKVACNEGAPGRKGIVDQRDTRSTSRPGCSKASATFAAVRPARSARDGTQRSRSTSSGASPPAAERCASNAATVLDPAPAASDQNPTRRPLRRAAGRVGAIAARGSDRPVASLMKARAICDTGEASRNARSLLTRRASGRAPHHAQEHDAPVARRSRRCRRRRDVARGAPVPSARHHGSSTRGDATQWLHRGHPKDHGRVRAGHRYSAPVAGHAGAEPSRGRAEGTARERGQGQAMAEAAA